MLPTTKPLQSRSRTFGGESWEEKRERLDAEWKPLVDERRRKVHGWACLEEIPAELLGRLLGRTLQDGFTSHTFPSKAFGVMLVATRDGKGFGTLPRPTWYATREEALGYARKALAQQGKRYANKYGGAA